MPAYSRPLGVLASLALLVGAAPWAASAERPTVQLRPGATVFWTTDDRVDGQPAGDCSRSCADFVVEVLGHAEQLRVAADGAGRYAPTVEIYDAGGDRIARAAGVYSAEAFVQLPDPGRYVVRVVAGGRADFRLRAKLERQMPQPPQSSRPLLPNLQLVPPYQFRMSSTSAGEDLGCNAYEKTEYGAKRCLRFSLGPANTGDGPLMLEFPAMTGMVTPEPVFQLVKHADGTVSRRQAGTALWHKTHAHHHHQGFGSLELLKVTDPARGQLVRAGVGPKQGFCMLDFLIADWRSFRNAPAGATRQDCSFTSGATATQIGLGTGWADIYTYGLDGNYVEFGSNGDGRYVVRSVADARNDVAESHELDNAGYAYIEVRGTSIRVLERGHGTSPWDPRKRLADDLLPPNA